MRAQEFVEQRKAAAADVLAYVKQIHHDFRIDHAITDHPRWKLSGVPLKSLEIPDPEPGEVEDDPYNRVQWMDMATVDDITPDAIKKYPIVVDDQGYIIDGNHRALAARLRGMTHIPAWIPDASMQENFADGRNPQDRGDSRRHGIPKKATLATLDKISSSKTASPRKKQLAHWQANMRRGRAKKQK